ncbi:sialoadhesin-like [Salarias fasciatus]|uniref:sialoadhesin-like n=1 Tax=Salarias fasciatus TaxID=181472 RepID=UPI0011769136|nr:sialoadhesin-like [Salarias fasciatus]
MKVLTEDGGKVQFDGSKKNQHILTLRNVQKNDSAEYRFNVREFDGFINLFGSPGVTLIVTDLEVKVTPSPEVTEGQRVTLTCSTSCPLTHNSNYMWFFNGEPLNSNNKQLILEAFSHQHAGSYSCAVRTGSNISDRSAVKTLKVQSVTIMWEVVAAGVSAVLLLFILLSVIVCVRKKKTSSQSSGIEMSKNTQQLSPDVMYENDTAGSAEQDDHLYSRLHFSQTHSHDVYHTIPTRPAR